MGQIRNLTITAGAAPTPIRLGASSRTLLQNTSAGGALIYIAYQRDLFGINPGESAQFFTLNPLNPSQPLVFEPNPLTGNTDPELGYLFYAYCPAGLGNATIEIWQQGQTQMM